MDLLFLFITKANKFMKNLNAKTQPANVKKLKPTKQFRTGSFTAFSDDLFCNGITERINGHRLHIDSINQSIHFSH